MKDDGDIKFGWYLVQDDACHWYLIPAWHLADWNYFVEHIYDDPMPDDPTWAIRVDGVHTIRILEYVEEK